MPVLVNTFLYMGLHWRSQWHTTHLFRCVGLLVEFWRLPEMITSPKFELRTPRLSLRWPQAGDLDFLVELFADPQVMRFSLTGPLTPDQTAAHLSDLCLQPGRDPLGLWIVDEVNRHSPVAICGFLKYQPPRELSPHLEIAYRVMPRYWGQGYATESVRACLDYARASGVSNPIHAMIEDRNQASTRVAIKAGFQLQGETLYQGLPVKDYVWLGTPTASREPSAIAIQRDSQENENLSQTTGPCAGLPMDKP